MIKLPAVALAFALSAIAAAPVFAADLPGKVDVVRIRLEGKTDAQISTEVRAAAQTVCRHSDVVDCFHLTFMDANYRLDVIRQAQSATSRPRQQVASN